jgi:hypothetical protein
VIGEFRNWREFWNIVESNSDMMRVWPRCHTQPRFMLGLRIVSQRGWVVGLT